MDKKRVRELLDEMVKAFDAYRDACLEFEEGTGIQVCYPNSIQLNEGGVSPFLVAEPAGRQFINDHGDNGEFRSFGIEYNGVDIHWLSR